jgi:hypothetical protein
MRPALLPPLGATLAVSCVTGGLPRVQKNLDFEL